MKSKFRSSLFLVLVPFCAKAQDPDYSQYRSGVMMVNPAFAGTWACARAEMGYRLQWPKLGGNYQTFNASYDQYVHKFGGLGVNYYHDVAGGVFTTDAVDICIAPRFVWRGNDSTRTEKLVIQPGVSLGYRQNRVDWNGLTFGDMIDPRRGFVYNTNEVPSGSKKSNVDFSAGLLVYNNRFAAGAAAYHITEPDMGFIGPSPLPVRFVAHASGILGKLDDETKHVNLIPSVVYMRQQDFHMLEFALTAMYNHINVGAGMRVDDAVIFSAGYEFKFLRLGYSYDMTISSLQPTGGAHEVHLSARFWDQKWKRDKLNLRMFN